MNRRTIRSLPFKHNRKPELGFEIFRLSSLYDRADQRAIDHGLEVPQRPEFHILYLGTRGKGVIEVDFTRVPLAAHTLTVVARGRVQRFVVDRGVEAWMLMFAPEFLASTPGSSDPLVTPALLSTLGGVPSLVVPPGDRAELLTLVEQLDAEHARPLDAIQPWLLSSLLRAVLLRAERLFGGGEPAPAAFGRFLTILERDCTRTRSVAHYARAVGLSPRRLAELVVARTGKSTKQLVDERVILEQQRLLAHTGISVKELATQTGFDEPTNLVKFFRHHTQQTPLEFRALRRIVPIR